MNRRQDADHRHPPRAPMLGLVDRLVWIEEGRMVADGPKDAVLRALAGGTTAD